MNNTGKRILGAFIFLAVFAGAIAIVMLLWNTLIPSIIGWSAINYWQAAGLIILCKLLFGGIGHWGHHGRCFGHNRKENRDLHEKMRNMSRDERKEFIRQRMGQGWGPFGGMECKENHTGKE